jgi:diketogulonate reductase-like aldo/keto reductase
MCIQNLIRTEHCAHFMHVQTRFTPRKEGSLFIKPYLRESPLKKQVKASVESSLSNLRHHVRENHNDAYVDCMLLHMPKFTQKEVVQTWHILESYVPHQIRTLGLSHARYKDLERVWSMSAIRPSVVQNHFVPQERCADF